MKLLASFIVVVASIILLYAVLANCLRETPDYMLVEGLPDGGLQTTIVNHHACVEAVDEVPAICAKQATEHPDAACSVLYAVTFRACDAGPDSARVWAHFN